MGTDINLVVEVQDTAGSWRLTESASGSTEDWYDVRAYECFTMLTGLEFSQRGVRPLTPVAELRGWPRDAAPETIALLTSWSDSTAYGHSWLSSRDLARYDWDARLAWSYMTAPPDGQSIDSQERAAIEEYVRKNGRPPAGWKVSGWSRDGFPVVGSITRRELAQPFLDRVVEPLRLLAGDDPDSARCVFSFVR